MDDSFPVDLPVLAWGHRSAARRALFIHGVGSAAGTWWQIASGLAATGWRVEAPDLRGHGAAPATLRYGLDDYVSDLEAFGGGWDLVVGHSLGGALAVLLASRNAELTGRVMLLDPAIRIPEDLLDVVVARQTAGFDEPMTLDSMAAANPRWHPEDVARRLLAAAAATRFAVERTFRDNPRWNLTETLAGLRVPVSILGADPELDMAFSPRQGADVVSRNPMATYATVVGAGHSVHRDDPERVLAELKAFTSG